MSTGITINCVDFDDKYAINMQRLRTISSHESKAKLNKVIRKVANYSTFLQDAPRNYFVDLMF